MNPILTAAVEVERLCVQQGWPFCFIGGLAVLRWGEPRLTRDVDLTVVTGFGGEGKVIDKTLESFKGRFPDIKKFAMENRVLLVKAANGIPLDIALGALPFEERAAQRASAWKIDKPFPMSGSRESPSTAAAACRRSSAVSTSTLSTT